MIPANLRRKYLQTNTKRLLDGRKNIKSHCQPKALQPNVSASN